MTKTPALLEEIIAAQPHKGERCTIVKIADELSDEDKKGLLDALDNPSIYGASIARALKARGFSISPNSVQRHRRRICTCP